MAIFAKPDREESDPCGICRFESHAESGAAVEVIATGVRPARNSASHVHTCDKSSDEAVWEGTPVKRSDPIPR